MNPYLSGPMDHSFHHLTIPPFNYLALGFIKLLHSRESKSWSLMEGKQVLIGTKMSDGCYYSFHVLVGLDYKLSLYGYIMLDTVYVGDYVGKIGNSLN